MTDNGSAYRSRRFAKALRWLAIRHIFTRSYTPKTNRKAERFIQTLLREWAFGLAHPSSEKWRLRASTISRARRKRALSTIAGNAPSARIPLSVHCLMMCANYRAVDHLERVRGQPPPTLVQRQDSRGTGLPFFDQ